MAFLSKTVRRQIITIVLITGIIFLFWWFVYKLSEQRKTAEENYHTALHVQASSYRYLIFFKKITDKKIDFDNSADLYSDIKVFFDKDKLKITKLKNEYSKHKTLSGLLSGAEQHLDRLADQARAMQLAKQDILTKQSELLADVRFSEKQVGIWLKSYKSGAEFDEFEQISEGRKAALESKSLEDINRLIAKLDKFAEAFWDSPVLIDRLKTYELFLKQIAAQISTAGFDGTAGSAGSAFELNRDYAALLDEAVKLIGKDFRGKRNYPLYGSLLFVFSLIPLFAYIFFLQKRDRNNRKQLYTLLEHISKGDYSVKNQLRFPKLKEKFDVLLKKLSDADNYIEQIQKKPKSKEVSASSDNYYLSRIADLHVAVKSELSALSDKLQENNLQYDSLKKLGEFNDILRDNRAGTEEMSFKLVSNLSAYVGAEIVGLYIRYRDKEKDILKLTGAYAYNLKKEKPKDIPVGNGLVGTCARENNIIYLSEIPDDYLKITTGFGEIPPEHLYLYPVSHEDTVFGVLEISAVNALDKRYTEFVKALCKDIALTLSLMQADKSI